MKRLLCAALAAASLLAVAPAPAAQPIRLASGVLEPDSPRGRALAAARPSPAEPSLRVVQLAPSALAESLEVLRDAGMEVVDHLSGSTYLVRGEPGALARLDALAAPGGTVEWHGDWAAELKLDASSRAALAAPDASEAWAIQLVEDPIANGPTLTLIAQNKTAAELFRMTVLKFLDVVVPLPASVVPLIAARPDVVSIRRWVEPVKAGERDAQIVAGNVSAGLPSATSYLSWLGGRGFTQAQFTASNFLVDVSDSGIDAGTTSPNHPGLKTLGSGASRIGYLRLVGTANASSTLQGCDGHGTVSAHVLAGYDSTAGAPHADGSGFHYGLGVCPFVKLGNSVIYDPNAFTHPVYSDLISRAYQDGARISSNGWGVPNAGAYDVVAQAYDALVRDAQPTGATVSAPGNQEIVVVAAAGNLGPGAGILSPGSAKNVLTVGAAEGVQTFGGADQCGVDDTLSSSADDMHPASSRGPTADGRAKPDLVAPGTHVSGGVPQAASPGPNGTALACYASATPSSLAICAGTGSLPAGLYFPSGGQQLFTASSGTSMATAAVSGAAALLRQQFLNGGRPAPSPAMTKAVLVNAARYLAGTGANDTLPSPAQGMGEVDLGDALDRLTGVGSILRDEVAADLFTASAQTRTFTGSVLDTGKPFRVTLAWTDAPGSTVGNAWNNDLDLSVTVGGNTYKGNVFTGSASVTGGVADPANNVESVFLPAGTSGPFTVTVTASSINSDGVPGNVSPLDQDFALVVYNGGCGTPAPVAGSDSPVCAGGDLHLTATGLPSATYSWTGPSGFTSSAQNPTITGVTAANAGIYSVTQTDSACTSSPATVVVVVGTVPATPTAGSNSPVTAGGTLMLTASTIAGASYLWAGPNGFTSAVQNPTIPSVTTAASGVYSVTATVNGCTSAAATTSVWVATPLKLYTVTPCRVVDTRGAPGPMGGPALAAGATRTFVIGGQCGVPVDAAAVAGNVTVDGPTTGGDLRVVASGSPAPPTSVINFGVSQTRANNGIFALAGTPGGFDVIDDQPAGTTDFLVDVTGYFK